MPIGKEALLKNKPQLQVNVHHGGGVSFVSLPDRAKVVRGLPDVATIMEDKVPSAPWPTASSPTLGSLPHPSKSTNQQSSVDPRAGEAGSARVWLSGHPSLVTRMVCGLGAGCCSQLHPISPGGPGCHGLLSMNFSFHRSSTR